MGQMPNESGMCYCQKEKKWLREGQFYSYKDGSKTKMCKKCLTLHIDNFDPSTFLWLLQELDVPYIPAEWNVLRDRAFAKDPKKMNGMSVFGKYLSKMKLKQWKQYGWGDSEMLQAQNQRKTLLSAEEASAEEEAYQQELKEKLAAGQITQAEYKTLMPTAIQNRDLPIITTSEEEISSNNPYRQENFIREQDLPDLSSELTDEDKKYLALKWGRLYKLSELIELEENYKKMTDSFDIHDADTENSLILYCKNNLKMNQALDCGDFDAYNKISRTQDALRKSSKFAAKERKEQDSEFIDSIGQLVAYCEKYGDAIPKYEINVPYDIIDKIINDLKEYNKSLVYEDPAIAREIEDYLKKKDIQEEQKKDKEAAKKLGLEQLELTDQDIADYNEYIEQQKDLDKIIHGGEEEQE